MRSAPGVALANMGYRHVWALDFEFVADPGHKPRPICLVAKCVVTGQEIRLWCDELSTCPFEVPDDVLFIAF